MAGVHRLEHIQCLGAPRLADDDAVGPHTQRVFHQLADRHVSLVLLGGRARLQPHHVGLAQPQFGHVLDRHHPLVLGDKVREDVERRRLARSGAARNQDVQPGLDAALQKINHIAAETTKA